MNSKFEELSEVYNRTHYGSFTLKSLNRKEALFTKTVPVSAGVQIIWSKADSHSTQIAIGTVVVAPEYMERATVTEDARGSTLHIGIAKVFLSDICEYFL